jgi:hypothetical protein
MPARQSLYLNHTPELLTGVSCGRLARRIAARILSFKHLLPRGVTDRSTENDQESIILTAPRISVTNKEEKNK